MIKSLLEPDEPESKEKTENVPNESDAERLKMPYQTALKKSEQIPMVEALPEKEFLHQPEELENRLNEIEAMSEEEIEELLRGENLSNNEPYLYGENPSPTENQNPYADVEPANANLVYDEVNAKGNANIPQNQEINLPEIKPKDFTPESKAESIRQSGMAWSAAVALFGSVLFFMIIGWFADLLLGTAPWSLVGGIVIGGIMGFIQFFRISSRIFKPQKSDFEKTSLRGNEENDQNSDSA